MRTDAKIGFAILGVLVLVLMGFFVVNSRKERVSTTRTTPEPVKLQTDTPHIEPHIDVPTASGDPVKPVEPVSPPPVKPTTVDGALAQNTGLPYLPNPGGQLTPDEIKQMTADRAGTAKPAGKGEKVSDTKVKDPKVTNAKKGEPPALAAGQRFYTIRAGQTLTSIASDLYGDPHAWKQIRNANPGLNPSKLRVGLKIKIPDPAVVRPRPGNVIQASDVVYPDDGVTPLSEPPLTAGQTYRVQSGDTLYKLAKRFLGAGQRADELYELNRGVIGTSSSRLRIGMVLRLPSAAGALSDASR